MSEKRRRNQQRRQRRKAKAAGRSRGNSTERLLAQVARLATASVSDITTALDAEVWASSLLGEWRAAIPEEDPQAVMFPSLVQAFEAIGTAPALASLRAMSTIGATAREAADRLAAAGLPEPEWVADLGDARPTGAALLEEPVFDDGVSVVIEFDGSHALLVDIDNNIGIARDVLVVGPLAEVRDDLLGDLTMREIGLDEARARVEYALFILDATFDPPVGEEVWSLRTMLDARLRRLPDGFEITDDVQIDRDALVADFLASPEGKLLLGDEDAVDIVGYAIDFGNLDNHGGPLRWSPAVVEVFMVEYLPAKVMAEPEFFARVPDVLAEWVRYAGRRRGVPADAARIAVEAVGELREDLLNAVTDPDAWRLANALAEEAIEAGIDPTDDAALARFMRDHAP